MEVKPPINPSPSGPGGVANAVASMDPALRHHHQQDPSLLLPVGPSNASGTYLPGTPVRGRDSPVDPALALLVGTPPPPPPTPPPSRKKRRSSSRKKKRQSDGGTPAEPEGGSAKKGTPRERSRPVLVESSRAPDLVEHQPMGSFSPLGSPAVGNNNNDRRFIDDRLRAARAIYQSETLVMDPPETGSMIPTPVSEEENSSPTRMFQKEDRRSSSPRKPVLDAQPVLQKPSPVSPRALSPGSINTEQMDNRHHHEQQQQQLEPTPLQDASTNVASVPDSLSNAESTDTGTSSGRRLRPKTPERLRRMLSTEKKASNKTSDKKPSKEAATKSVDKKKRSKTPEQNLHAAETPKQRNRRPKTARRSTTPGKRRSGIMSGIGRGGGNGSVSDASVPRTPESRQETEDGTTSRGGQSTGRRGFFRNLFRGKKGKDSVGDGDGATVTSDGLHTLKSGSTVKKTTTVTKAMEEESHLDDASKGVADNHREVGDHHIDAHDSKGIERHQNVIGDRPDLYFSHDEVSTLTAPTVKSILRQQQDPKEWKEPISDPAGRYFDNGAVSGSMDPGLSTRASMDPFPTSFSEDPAASDPFAGSDPFAEPTKSPLNVTVNGHHDPDGSFARQELSVTMPAVKDPSPRREESTRSDDHPLRDPSPKLHDPSPTIHQDPSPRHNDPSPRIQVQDPSPRVHVPVPKIQDPSPRGFRTTTSFPENPAQDPFGESPLHKSQSGPAAFRDGAPYAPDPPLHLESLDDSDDSSQEEKKEDEIKAIWIRKLPPTPNKSATNRSPSPRLRRQLPSPSHREKDPEEAATPKPHVQQPSVQLPPPSPLGKAVEATSATPSSRALRLSSSHLRSPSPRGKVPENSSTPSSRQQIPPPPSPHGGKAPKETTEQVPAAPQPPSSPHGNLRKMPTASSDSSSGSHPQQISIQLRPGSSTQDKTLDEGNPPRIPPAKGTPTSATSSPRLTRRGQLVNRLSTRRFGAAPSPTAASDVSTLEGSRASSVSEPIDSDLILEEESSKQLAAEKEVARGTVQQDETRRKKSRDDMLTMSSAARMNAKTVAYIHTLNGDPSPRKFWRKSADSDDDGSPTNRAGSSKWDPLDGAFSSRRPGVSSPESLESEKAEGEATSLLFTSFNSKFKGRKAGRPAKRMAGAKETDALPHSTVSNISSEANGESMRFSAYSSKFKHRSSGKSTKPVPQDHVSRPSRSRSKGENQTSSSKITPANESTLPAGNSRAPHASPISAFGFGVSLLRERRENDIISGRSKRVIPPTPKKKVPVVKSFFRERAPRDPIQRAGRRLLAKAAVPIQAEIRRYLAQREAVDRMWAIIEIQSYMRRWKAQVSFLAYAQSAVAIQKVFRGMGTRNALEKWHEAAIQVQRMTRGYLAAVRTFDTVYRIILIQARARGRFARERAERKKTYIRETSAKSIQTFWRCRSVRSQYRNLVVDVIIAQSVIRRKLAGRTVLLRRAARHGKVAIRIQTAWRGFRAYNEYNRHRAATTIQTAWRGFQAYTDYIFTLVDVILVQRTVRQWVARKKVQSMRREISATKIQSHFRRYRAQMQLLYALVKIITVQSVTRRFIVQKRLGKDALAATKIQAAWRGFWNFSHYIIMLYQVTRFQAVVRGALVRENTGVQLGCCIMIQSAARGFLAVQRVAAMKATNALVMASAEAMRETHAARHIQFWWRVVLDCRKEKHAALVIERFFLMVKKEVGEEIERMSMSSIRKRTEKKKHPSSSSTTPRKWKEEDEKWLERIWLNTVEDGETSALASPPPSGRSSSSRRDRKEKYQRRTKRHNISHRASSPPMNLVMRHERDDPEEKLKLTYSADGTEISETPSTRKSRMSSKEMSDDLSLEEAFLDATIQQGKQGKHRKFSADKYIKKYGIRTTQSQGTSKVHHFFADDLESTVSSIQGMKSPSNSVYKKGTTPRSTRSSTSAVVERAYKKVLQNKARQSESPKAPFRGESPRHGKIRHYSSEHQAPPERERYAVEDDDYVGEEFGLI